MNPTDDERYVRNRRLARTYNISNWNEVTRIPDLPSRLVCNELKDWGMTRLSHADDKKTVPWLPAGIYKVLNERGRLYLLDVHGSVCGVDQSVWCIRPIFRIQATTRAA